MADFITDRLDPAGRVSLEHQQEQRDQDALARRRTKRPAPRVEAEEPADDEPPHELDQMA